jgi:hypothetical protein
LAAATVLLRRGEKAGGVRLVQLLDFKDGRIRSAAFDVLQEFSGSSFNYVPYGLAAMRQPALAKWTGWLRAQPDILEKRTVSVARKEEVQQVLLSTSSGSVQLCDLTGAVRFSIPMSAYDAQLLRDGRIVIAGRDSGSALVVDQDGKKLRVIENLKSPSDIEYLPNDNLLVLENGTGIAKEFNARGHPVWQVQGLENPFDIDRLPNGNTLIADSGNNRLVEFDPRGEIVWECKDIGFVNNVVRLRNGNTAYTTYTSGEVIVVSPEKMKLHEAHLKGSTLYAIQEIGDQLVVADGAGMQIIWLDQRCKTQKTTQLPFKFMDAFFTR